jgi:1-acyl-sn-glycerol-3-phosphate acyltransferase
MSQSTDAANTVEKSTMVGKQPPKKPAKNLYEPYSTPRLAYVALCCFARFVFFLTFRTHVRGRYNIPRKGPYIIASNHLSWLDVPLVALPVPGKVVYMAKDESFHGRFGWLVRFLGAFPVKRGEGDRQALRTSDELLKHKKVLVIFPEGTRSKTHTLAKAHAGLGMIALRAGVPVIPVAIYGSEHAWKRFNAHVTIEYGEPVLLKPASAKITRNDITAATDEIMRRIAAMMPERYRGFYGATGTETEDSGSEEDNERPALTAEENATQQ